MDRANYCGLNTSGHQLQRTPAGATGANGHHLELDMIGLKGSFELHPPTRPKPIPYRRALRLLQLSLDSLKSMGMLEGCCSCLKAHLPPDFVHIE